MAAPKGFQDKVSLIWSVADILRGDFKPHEYGQTILPFVVLRRLECALEKTKDNVISKSKSLEGKINDMIEVISPLGMVEEERGGVPGWGKNPLIPTQRERWLVRWKQGGS